MLRLVTLAELNSVIGENARNIYSRSDKIQFIDRFLIRFSEDYETQFENTLDLIKSSFSLADEDTAVLYHAIFRSKLLDLSLGPKSRRAVEFKDLKRFLDEAEVRVFEGAYLKYVGEEKYARLIKKMYFTFSAPNIENFKRLFLVECDTGVSLPNLIKIAFELSRKFYKKGKSPQPYVVFRNLQEGSLSRLKQNLLDHGIHFFDGTHFNGDRFRLVELIGGPIPRREFILKLVPEQHTRKLIQTVQFDEVFQFFIDGPMQLKVAGNHRRIQIRKTEQILQIVT